MTAPLLSGVAASVTYAENLVNATPQVIDTDVTFTDPDNNYTGGTLTVTGLLAEDRISVRNQGTGAGQIGVSGSNILYGNVVIGTFTGGVGNSFTVTFNGAATSAAIDALVQNLTYANVSDTPTADRTLTLDIVDALGAHVPGFASFSQASGASSPVNNLTFGVDDFLIRASFGDLDGDGDLDAFFSSYNSGYGGTPLETYRNNGNGTFTSITNPLNSTLKYGAVAFLDIDGDGDLDAVVGHGTTISLRTFQRQANNSFIELTGGSNPFANADPGFAFGDNAAPAAVDVDGDGLTDLVWTSGEGPVHYFHHNANHSFTNLTGVSNPFNAINLTSGFTFKTVTFADVDGDGDPDMVASNGTTIRYFRNIAGTFTEQTGAYDGNGNGNPFNGASGTGPLTPVFADFDGDGDSELVVGQGASGPYLFFQNSGTFGQKINIHVTAEAEVNTAPTQGANSGLSLNEGATGTITAARLDFNDAQQADTAITYTVTSAATNGLLQLSGATLGLGATFTQDDINNNRVTYVHDGSETTSGSFGFSVSDGAGGSVTGQSFAFTVTPVNDAPIGSLTGANPTFTEGGAAQAIFEVFSASTIEAGQNFKGFVFTVTNVTDGADEIVSFDGSDIELTDGNSVTTAGNGFSVSVVLSGGTATVTITKAAGVDSATFVTLLDGMAYSNASDAPTTADRVVTLVSVTDTGGIANGGEDTVAAGSISTIEVVSVNDAPYLDLDFTDISAGGLDSAASWAEGDAPVLLAFAVELDDDDADNSYPGATLTVAFTAGGTADDQLSILSVGDDLGEIRVTGSNIYYEGTLVGTFTGGNDGNPLVVTFNADACHCAVQLVTASITFANDSDTPDTGDRTVTFTFVDGGGTALGGADTATADVTVTVTDANDAPTVAIANSLIPSGDEFTPHAPEASEQAGATILVFDDGSYLLAWHSDDTSGEGDYAIFGRHYDAAGDPIAEAFKINTETADGQAHPSGAVLADGSYVVAWSSFLQDGDGFGVYAQRFAADDSPIDGEFLVNTTVAGGQSHSTIVALDDGGFLVAWEDTDGHIYSQRYDADGDTAGGEEQVDSAGGAKVVSVSLASGGYVLAWETAPGEIAARQFDAAGDPVGAEFQVNGTGAGAQGSPSIGRLADGGYVIAWQSDGQDGDQHGIYAQRYAADGTPVDGEFLVNTRVSGDEIDPSVTGLAGGGFVISWGSWDQDGDQSGIYAQRYAADGSALGAEFRINATAAGSQTNPFIAGLPGGGLVAAWETSTGSFNDVVAQRLDAAIAAIEQVALDLKGSITLGDVDDNGGSYTVTLSVTEGLLVVDPGTSGVLVDDSDQQNIILTGTLAEIQALLGSDPTSSVTYTYDDDYLPFGTIEFGVTIDDGIESTTSTVTIDVTPVNDAAELDLDYFSPGNDAVAIYYQGDPATPIAYDAIFDDDNADWDGATLTIAITGATADDQLIIDDSLLFDVTVVGNDIFYDGDVVGTWSGGENGNALVITFNADACACAIEEVAYGIAYTNSAATLTLGTRDVTFTFVDGGGTALGGQDTAIATVELTLAIPPADPVIDEGGAASGDEDVAIELTGVVITDDGDSIGLVTVHLAVEHGTITIRTDVVGGIDASNIIGGVNGGHGITLTGTPAEINLTLAASGGLTYVGDSDFYGSDALTITAHDGTPGSALMISSLSALPFGGVAPTAVAVADIDGDLLDDLVLGLEADGGDPGFILTLFGGLGGAPLPALSPEAFAFGDFDGDDEIDIAFAAYDVSGTGYVGYLSSETGDIEIVANVPYALDLVAGDFDGDGLMDLAVADSDNGRVAIILQTAPGVFAAPDYSASSGVIANGIRTGDFNGDGVIDLLVSYYGAVGTYAPPGSIALMLGIGDGTFAAATPVWSGPSNVGGIVVADFNGDGYDDYAFASIDNSADPAAVNGVQVALGNGDGTFADPVGYATTNDGAPMRVIAADLNGDGIADLVVTNYDDPGTFSVLVGNGDGSFQAPVDFDTGDLAYVAASGDFDFDGDLDLMIGNYGDATFEAFNNDTDRRGSIAVKIITVAPVDDASVAVGDTGSTVDEDDSVVIDVVANDTDIEGDTPVVAEIDGQPVTVGVPVTLASGATVTLNIDGTLTYNPNGAFASLISSAQALSTGALNTSADDSFAYTLVGGSTATVTVTVDGVQSTGDQLWGDGGDNTITGTSGADTFMLQDGGDDTVDGGDGIDGFYMGAGLSAGDAIDGGASNDLLGLQGDYAGYTFSATNLVGIETLVLLSGSVTTYSGGPGTARYDYDLTTIDANVLPGQMFVVNATTLLAGEDLRFDGSAETDGSFFFYGGAGDDTLIGGALADIFASGLGQDTLTGGGGNDVFYYRLTAESPDSAHDLITDFTAGDLIHLWALGEPGGLGVSFIGDDDFSNVAGQLRVTGSGTSWTVEMDVDGDGDADFIIDVTTTASDYQWGKGDFIM